MGVLDHWLSLIVEFPFAPFWWETSRQLPPLQINAQIVGELKLASQIVILIQL